MKTIGRDLDFGTPTRLATAPSLWVWDGFLDEATIEAVLALFGDETFLAEHADHYGWDTAGFAAEIPADQHPVLQAVMAKVEAAVGLRSALTPTFRMRYYDEGQGHRAYVDAYTFEDTRLAVSVLIGLVEPAEGGETRFLAAEPESLAIAPKRGRLVAWTSTVRGGADDAKIVHDGATVVRGSKGVLLGFLYLEGGGSRGS